MDRRLWLVCFFIASLCPLARGEGKTKDEISLIAEAERYRESYLDGFSAQIVCETFFHGAHPLRKIKKNETPSGATGDTLITSVMDYRRRGQKEFFSVGKTSQSGSWRPDGVFDASAANENEKLGFSVACDGENTYNRSHDYHSGQINQGNKMIDAIEYQSVIDIFSPRHRVAKKKAEGIFLDEYVQRVYKDVSTSTQGSRLTVTGTRGDGSIEKSTYDAAMDYAPVEIETIRTAEGTASRSLKKITYTLQNGQFWFPQTVDFATYGQDLAQPTIQYKVTIKSYDFNVADDALFHLKFEPKDVVFDKRVNNLRYVVDEEGRLKPFTVIHRDGKTDTELITASIGELEDKYEVTEPKLVMEKAKPQPETASKLIPAIGPPQQKAPQPNRLPMVLIAIAVIAVPSVVLLALRRASGKKRGCA